MNPKKKLFKLFIFSFIYFFDHSIYGQYFNSHFRFSDSCDLNIGEQQGVFQLFTSNFIKNNEYFNEIVEGYTLIGFCTEPILEYRINNKTSIRGGLSVIKFFGQEKFYKIEPIFSIQHSFSKILTLEMGSLNFSEHLLPAPLLNPERFYLHRVDNGAGLKLKTTFLYSDTWLAWDQFSFYGDTIQEIITSGSGNRIFLYENENFELQIPLYFLITHQGGQLLRPKKPIETLVNTGAGVDFYLKINKFNITINPNLLLYRKLSTYPSQPFSNGWALYNILRFEFQKTFLECGYWYGNTFIAPRGEPIFWLKSMYQNHLEKKSTLWLSRFGYQHHYPKNILFQIALETYYFPSEKRLDYNFWIHLNWYFSNILFSIKS